MIPQATQRDRDLAEILAGYSVSAKPGDLVQIHCIGSETLGLGAACMEACLRLGAAPYLHLTDPVLDRCLIRDASDEALKRYAEFELGKMVATDCYIGIRGSANIFEQAGLPEDKLDRYSQVVMKPVHLEERVKRTRWCVLRYPTPSMAQLARKSTPEFATFYYDVCCVDYGKMAKAAAPLGDLMARTNKMRFAGPGYDLEMTKAGIGAVPCCGTHNIPDGECFTAPKADDVNGTVAFNTITSHHGVQFDSIKLTFKDGKVVEAKAGTAEQTAALNKILDQDEGARRLGEVALGFNPMILHPMCDTLFDEKIAGSFHMALGQCYEETENGNRSALHWDLVSIQRPDCGGGEIWFDDKLIRKDGLFVIDELKGLNPDSLAGG